jgi:hypothetical protein
MQRNEPERRRDPRKTAERDASQPMGGQPRPGDDESESLQKPENVPSFLTARELQARDPAKNEGQKPTGERPATGSGQKRSGD